MSPELMGFIQTISSTFIGAIVSIAVCLINNKTQREKELHAIELQIAEIKASNQQTTSIIEERINNLTEHVNKHNNLVDRMYKVEELTARLGDMEKSIDERLDRMEGKG